MKKLIFVLLGLNAFGTLAQPKLSKEKVGDFISMKLPSTFSLMSDRTRLGKFVSDKVPLATYTSEDQLVDLVVNTSQMVFRKGDEAKIQRFYRKTFQTLFDDIQYFQDTIREVNGRKFIVFEFLSTLKEENAFSGVSVEKNYTYIQYTSYKDRVLLFHFGCRPRNMQTWQPLARVMMESVKVRE